jgi:orotidine-5'-phosphate decarboxylase
VVCSAQESALLKQSYGQDFLCVTPGIRLPHQAAVDQKRIMTPLEAIQAGSDYLVMGRSITDAADPNQLLTQIIQEMEHNL